MSITMPMKYKIDLNAPLTVRKMGTLLAQNDNQANAFVLEIYQDGKETDLSEYSVIGTMIRADGIAVLLDQAEIVNNRITLTLNDDCYQIAGFFYCTIRLIGMGKNRTILKVQGMVEEESANEYVTEETYTSLDKLIEEAVEKYLGYNPPSGGGGGVNGKNGATFTPYVSPDGVISWTNNGNLANPTPVDIKGPKGDDGYSPTVDVRKTGKTTTITITDKNGTKTAEIHDGQDGSGGGGGVTLTDDGAGNVTINGVVLTDDGAGNVSII